MGAPDDCTREECEEGIDRAYRLSGADVRYPAAGVYADAMPKLGLGLGFRYTGEVQTLLRAQATHYEDLVERTTKRVHMDWFGMGALCGGLVGAMLMALVVLAGWKWG